MGADSDEVRIRPAGPEDLDAIVAVTEAVFAPYAIESHIAEMLGPGACGAGWIDVKARDLARELRGRPPASFVAVSNGQVVGYVTGVVNRLASRGTIANLAVLPDGQGRGVGRRLLLRAIERFRELQLKQAKIETLVRNEVGQHLYPSVGFREAARQIHYVMPLQ